MIGATRLPWGPAAWRKSSSMVLFDEASQITLPLAIMGMLAGSKYIFIGTKPAAAGHGLFAEEAAQTSIFGYLAGRGNETMLNVTYRLNDVLTGWPNRSSTEMNCNQATKPPPGA